MALDLKPFKKIQKFYFQKNLGSYKSSDLGTLTFSFNVDNPRKKILLLKFLWQFLNKIFINIIFKRL